MYLVLLKGKLFQTENYSPLLAALKKYDKKNNILIFYPSKEDYEVIKKNKDIFTALSSISTIKHFYSTEELMRNYKVQKYIAAFFSVLHRNIVLLFLLYRKTIIFLSEDIPYTKLLFLYNKYLLKSKKVFLLVYPYNLKMLKANIKRVKDGKRPFMAFKNALKIDSNILISSYSKSNLNKICLKIVNKYKFVNIGYNINSWPSWLGLLEEKSKGEASLLSKKKYIFFPLAVIKRESYTSKGKQKFDFSEAILLLLNTVNSINKNILIILRPHPTTDMIELANLLEKSKHNNFDISYINSLFLIKYSKFVIRYGISLMDPKVTQLNKINIRYHTKQLVQQMHNSELANSELLKSKNIHDVTSTKQLKLKISKAFKNKIPIKKIEQIKVNEAKIIRNFLNTIE